MSLLDTWTVGEHTDLVAGAPTTHPTYREDTGPGVVVSHEIPGITPQVVGFAEELVEVGDPVVPTHLFGRPEEPIGAGSAARALRQVCSSRGFTRPSSPAPPRVPTCPAGATRR